MKKINYILILLAAFMITFTSCTKEEISTLDETTIPTDVENDSYNPLLDNIENRDDLEGSLILGCFTVTTPFALDVDGTVTEINTYEDLENAFDFDEDDVAINVDFVYPLTITYEDGEVAEIENGEALGEAFALCIPESGWEQPDSTDFDGTFPAFLITDLNSCYSLSFPLTLQDIDGTTYTVLDENELIEILSSENFLSFVFPLNLEGENGTVTANSSDDLFDLLLECQEQPWDSGEGEENECPLDLGGIACYDLSFPISVVLANGEELTINNYEELSNAMLDGNIENFAYPISLVQVVTGEVTTVNNDAELEQAIDDCWDEHEQEETDPTVEGGDAIIFFIFSSDFDGDCYSINFPIEVTTPDSTQIPYSSIEDVTDAFETNEIISYNLVYPVSVIRSSGETVTLQNQEDLIVFLEECQG